ncbi:MAG: Imm27 family immunity protein [Bacteroidota bacterium]
MEFSNKLNTVETILIGSWKKNGDKIIADEICERIEQLKSNYLKKVSVDITGWEVLYQDPHDNRYWLLTYPNSELHSGGPPILKMITATEVYEKFGIN